MMLVSAGRSAFRAGTNAGRLLALASTVYMHTNWYYNIYPVWSFIIYPSSVKIIY